MSRRGALPVGGGNGTGKSMPLANLTPLGGLSRSWLQHLSLHGICDTSEGLVIPAIRYRLYASSVPVIEVSRSHERSNVDVPSSP